MCRQVLAFYNHGTNVKSFRRMNLEHSKSLSLFLHSGAHIVLSIEVSGSRTECDCALGRISLVVVVFANLVN